MSDLNLPRQSVPATDGPPSYWDSIDSQLKRYERWHWRPVKCLSLCQISIAFVCLVMQIPATILHVSYRSGKEQFEKRSEGSIEHLLVADVAGTGIWVGLIMITCGYVGLKALQRNTYFWILSHLLINVLLLVLCIVLSATSIVSLKYLVQCRNHGLNVKLPNKSGYYVYERGQYIQLHRDPAEFFGEKFHYGTFFDGNIFYCLDMMFSAWLSLVGVIMISSLFMFVISVSLIYYNCKAICCKGFPMVHYSGSGRQTDQQVVMPSDSLPPSYRYIPEHYNSGSFPSSIPKIHVLPPYSEHILPVPNVDDVLPPQYTEGDPNMML